MAFEIRVSNVKYNIFTFKSAVFSIDIGICIEDALRLVILKIFNLKRVCIQKRGVES